VDIRIPVASEISTTVLADHFNSTERQELQVENKGGETLKLRVLRKCARVDIAENILKSGVLSRKMWLRS
jgi:hypothetical protein